MDDILLNDLEEIETKPTGHYETIKEYTKEIELYDENGERTGTETIVTGRELKWVWDDIEEIKNQLRYRRNKECFAVINRGQLWYDNLTKEQLAELKAWYRAWLNITDTLIDPEKPNWII